MVEYPLSSGKSVIKTLFSGTCPVVVTWKAVKHFTLRLSHTTGQVHLSAPLQATEAEVAEVLAAKARWIAQAAAKGEMVMAEHSKPIEDKDVTYLETQLSLFLSKWSKILQVEVRRADIKAVRSYWGKCLPHTKKVYFAMRLAFYPPEVIEYIMVHELLHFHIHNHGASFRQAMDRLLPDWRQRDKLLTSPSRR